MLDIYTIVKTGANGCQTNIKRDMVEKTECKRRGKGHGDGKTQIENVEQIVLNSRAAPSFSLH